MPLPSAAKAAPCSCATSGSISGSGFDRARITWPFLTHCGLIRPLTPVVAITMSARCMSDSSVTPSPPEAMSRATACGLRSVPSTRCTP